MIRDGAPCCIGCAYAPGMNPTVVGALIGAGSAVIVALAGIWANVRNTSANTEVSRRAVEAAQRTVEITEQGQVTVGCRAFSGQLN